MPVLATPLDELCQGGQLLTSSQGREVFAVTYEGIRAPMIVKHLSIPATQSMVNGLIYSGAVADSQAALDYYRAEMDDLRQELSRLEPMHDHPHFLPYLNCDIKEKTDGVGFDIYLLTLRAETVRELMTRHAFSPRSALMLGISAAGTLYALRHHGLLHRNVHPGNLYRDPSGTFRLGDLGTLPLSDLQYATQPDRYICEYTAPELCDVLGVPNETVDTYALGMVLWTIFNGYEPPFNGDEERRRNGEALPAPAYASEALADVLSHACAPKPNDRYSSPEELKAALEPLLEIASDEPILPPLPETAEAPDPSAETPTDNAGTPEPTPDTSGEDAPDKDAPIASSEDVSTPVEPEDEAATDEPTEDAPPAPTPLPEPSQRFQTAFAAAYEEEDGFPDDLTTDPSRVRHPSRLWLKILIPILIVAILAASAFAGVYYLRHRAHVINQLSLQLEGKDTLCVEIDAPADALLTVVLSDEAGRVLQSLPYNGEPLRFGDLDAGKEFTVTLQSRNDRELDGILTSKASTPMPTELLTFEATALSPTEISLEFTSTGYEPNHWTLTFSNEDGDSQTSSFSGHSLVINGLDAGSAYTFTITDAEDQPVLGTSTITCETETVVNLASFELDDSVYGELTVRWASTGNFAKRWYLTCSGSDGSYRAEEITDQRADFSYTLKDLPAGCSYEVQLSCEGLTNPSDATRTIELPLCTVTNFVAYATDSTTINVSWSFINGEQPDRWRLTCSNDGLSETQTFLLSENTCDIPNLLPNAEYHFELSAENGLLVGGCDPVTARTPEASRFDDYKTSGIFLGFFAMPNKANWGLTDLTRSTASFSAGGGMAFAVEVSYQYTNYDKHVNTLYIIRDNSGNIVQYTSGELSWVGSSVKETHFGGFTECPNKTGEYTLELYFNGKLLTSKKFNVV